MAGGALSGLLKLSRLLPIKPILHLYYCATRENKKIEFVPPEILQAKHNVSDAHWTKEWWTLQIPKMKHVVVEVYDAELKPGIDPAGKKGILVEWVKYEVIKEIPKNTAENFFKDKGFTEDFRAVLTAVHTQIKI